VLPEALDAPAADLGVHVALGDKLGLLQCLALFDLVLRCIQCCFNDQACLPLI